MANRFCMAVMAVMVGMSAGLIGCAGNGGIDPATLSQAQLNAIETREVEAGMDATFHAASAALFDAGYTIAMSDKSAGLITGSAGRDRTSERIWISPMIADDRMAISMQITPVESKLTSVRVKTSVNGEARVDKKAIDKIWVLMQRQVLMREPVEESNTRK